MKIITGTKEELKRMIDRAYRMMGTCKSLTDKYALADYISQLHDVLNTMENKYVELDTRRCFGSKKNQRAYYEYIDSLFDKLDENFIRNKRVHNDFFGEILTVNDDNLSDLVECEYSEGSTNMTKEEFYEVFFEFLKTYGLEKNFDRFIRNKRIFTRPLMKDDMYFGSVVHNPLEYDSSIVYCGFRYNLEYLLTTAHEFGHTYDLGKIKGNNAGKINLRYSYSSVYGEVISSLFEKLFYDFLYDRKYRVEQVKDQAVDYAFACKQHVLSTYILTLLDDETILNGPGEVSKEEILRQIRPYFEGEEIDWFVEERYFDTWKDQAYAYGDVLSTILKENVKEEGLNSELMKTFMNERTKMFSPEFITDNGFTAEAYQKIYTKDIERIKE